MSTIKLEAGEYTEEQLLDKIEESRDWPYKGCEYFYIGWEGEVKIMGWDGLSPDKKIRNCYGIYKERPLRREVEMVIKRREIFNTWSQVIIKECYMGIGRITDVREFQEVMSYPYTHHTIK